MQDRTKKQSCTFIGSHKIAKRNEVKHPVLSFHLSGGLRASLIFLFCLLFQNPIMAQETDAPQAPEEKYTAVDETPLYSTLTIPIVLKTADLEKNVNKFVTGTLYEDLSFYDNGGDDLMVIASKSRDISLFLIGNTIKYRVPLKIWLRKNLLIGSAEAEGELVLAFKTIYQIQEDWSVQTSTVIEYHEWLTPPALKAGFVQLPIKWIADKVLADTRDDLATTIDEQVAAQLSLKTQVGEAWKSIQEPILLSEEYDMWIKTTPETIGMLPFNAEYGQIKTAIGIHCINEVSFGKKPRFRKNKNLPDLRILDKLPDGFKVRVATDLPFKEAEKIARQNIVGQVFESGKRKVTVENIYLFGQEEKMVVKVDLNGAYDGAIFFKGTPILDVERNEITLDDLDYELDTKNFLHKTASWLFKGKIKTMMAESMVFPLGENIDLLRTQIQASLHNYQIQEGVSLHGTLDDMRVEDTYLTKEGIRVNLLASGKLRVNLGE